MLQALIKVMNEMEATLSKNCFRGARIALSGLVLMALGLIVASFINHDAGYATMAFGILCGVIGMAVYLYGLVSKT